MGRNEELVTQIQQGKTWLLEEMWECNKALVVYISARYQDGCGRHFDTADLLQAGYLGLHVAAMTYSPGRGAAFSTYAFFHIRKAMREVAGLHGKRDVIFQSIPFDAPLGEDGDDTLLDLIPCSQGADLVELQELQSIVRTAVDNIKDTGTLSRQFIGRAKASQIMPHRKVSAAILQMSGSKKGMPFCEEIGILSAWHWPKAMIPTTTGTRDSAHLDLTEHLLWRMRLFFRTLKNDSARPCIDS